ncbi:hypothetical protein [Burkholderia cenocepacia]|uniref:hypothetical protein n=1 Tax=Burkholderia cenocepacia TaxID=95486 RepID=UPI00285CB853|nr:hypothetical protein [Burkholderia cenocepacia]MDR8032273.1 macro domain-containing protein [Burkholderia cenocepacia]
MTWPIRRPSRQEKLEFQHAYRAWRAEQLTAITRKKVVADRSTLLRFEYEDDVKPLHPWRQAREALEALRDSVISELRWRPNPEYLPMMRKALGIPAYVPMTRPWWLSLLSGLVTPYIPPRGRLLAGRALLRRTRSYLGRAYIFERHVAPVWPTRSSYSSGIDRTLRALPLARRASAYDDLLGLERGDIDVLMRLGLNDVTAIPDTWHAVRRTYDRDVVHALIDEGILERLDDLRWLPTRHSYYSDTTLKIDVGDLREMARVLRSAGMPKARIPEILNHPYSYNAVRLSFVLSLCHDRGLVDVAGLFDAVGSRLWDTEIDHWHFILDTIGARTADDIQRFRTLLDLTHAAPVEVATWMRAHGASLDDLVDAREFLVQVAKSNTVSVAHLDCLAGAGLTPVDIAHNQNYVLHGRDELLKQYLDVIARHGYNDRASIAAFHSAYTVVSCWSLDKLLTVVGPLNNRGAAAEVANWAVRAHRRGNVESLEYLAERMPAKTLDALNQRLFAMDIGPALLRYVVEEQGLTDIRALYDWFYADAWGVKDYAGPRILDDAERVLIEDAFRRKNFAVLEGNRKCLADVVSARVRPLIASPVDRTDESWEAYHKARRQGEFREREALKPFLPVMLNATHGVLLRSLLETASQAESSMPALLSVFRPLIADTARGRGPNGPMLSDLEAEAIALTYGVATKSVQEYWARVRVDDAPWQRWYRDEPYLMRWQRNTFRVSRPLDHAGLAALAVAARFARRFSEADISVFDAAKHLRGSLLANPLADQHMLHRHLGVLLAAAAADEQVKEWVTRRLEAMSDLDDESAVAHREIGELHDFFRIVLPDALDAGQEQFVSRLSATEARDLSLRLDKSTSEDGDAHAMLVNALARTRQKVLQVYRGWSEREKRKFKTQRDEAHQSTLHAFVSKWPAAFFAKQATGLCSGGNTTMWAEARHAHLVVFDPMTGQLAGMALLYSEIVDAIDSLRPSLIIRAINPTVSMVASHEPNSVVDAYFDLAIDLAREHGLASVAFPPHSGQDFMSNRADIGSAIRKRYEGRSVPHHRWEQQGETATQWRDQPREIPHTFSAYEEGNGRVTTLYGIWRDGQPARLTEDLGQTSTV